MYKIYLHTNPDTHRAEDEELEAHTETFTDVQQSEENVKTLRRLSETGFQFQSLSPLVGSAVHPGPRGDMGSNGGGGGQGTDVLIKAGSTHRGTWIFF